MNIEIKNKHYLLKFIICIFFLFLLLFLFKLSLAKENVEYSFEENVVTKSNIFLKNEMYEINVNYPKFSDKKVNDIITNWVYKYIKEFKSTIKDNEYHSLIIEYSLYYINNKVNIFFEINNTINPNDINKSILINLDNKTISSITELYNEEIINEKLNAIKSKYPSFVSKSILESNINDFNIFIDDSGYTLYFTNLTYDRETSYIPELRVNMSAAVIEEYSVDESKKMVALTFDDGPSKYSLEILKCLELNNAKATFFELGNRMTNYREVTKKLYDSGMEIGNHSYSHKYLTKLKLSNALNEINSTSIVFNQITGDSIKLMRMPYGSINSTLRKNIPFPIISWSIDTKDWLHRDANISAPLVLDYVEDGDIILMHDVHYATIELVKTLVPELKARGYELVTVSELANYKNYTLEPGVVVKKMK